MLTFGPPVAYRTTLMASCPRPDATTLLSVLVLLWIVEIGSTATPGSDTAAVSEKPFDRDDYERQRREAHARLAASGEDTMYASTPAPFDRFPLHLPAPYRWVSERGQPLALATGDSSSKTDEVDDTMHMVAFFPSAADSGREGSVRVINHAARSGTVEIHAVDDTGRRFGPAVLAIGARETVHFNSGDLENGNIDKGLSRATGPGDGDWRLELSSALDIEVLAYVRTEDGFLTAMHDTVAAGETGHRVAFFNPGSNEDQLSSLRVVNVGDAVAEITVSGVDDHGMPGSGEFGFSVSPGAARTVTARELEAGDGLGDGTGKWQLLVESSTEIQILNLLDSPTRHITNLSTAPDLHDGGGWTVPLFPEADDVSGREGFVRVINRSSVGGEVTVDAFDDTDWDYEPVMLSLAAGQTANFNSGDLEEGNPDKGLSGGVGAGEGAWRLALASDLDLEVLAYVRTADGFVTAMHDSVPARGRRHRVPVFNPASNRDQVSLLRILNPSEELATVTVTGIDGEGRSPGSQVSFTVPANTARSITAQEFETGENLEGALGDGAGKWQLVVDADQAIVVMSLLESPRGHLTNLSTAGSRRARTAEEVFEDAISAPIIQAKCVNCHVGGGMSGNTRLVFVPDSEDDHEARNLRAFLDLLAVADNGAALILNKIRGVGHGGGIQVAASSVEFEDMRSFLDLLADDVDVAGPAFTAAELFDTVRMETARRTLYRSALIFAGRIPTAEELAPFPGGTLKQLRDTIRKMMDGPGFHDFLVVGANDRLLTMSLQDEYLLENAWRNSSYVYLADAPHFPGYLENYTYRNRTYARYGAVQEPLELIAHVAENDLPYTEILTADYTMANGILAKAYGDEVAFDDPDDPFEFRPVRIREYYRPNSTMDDYPHAGILNTLSFLRRYPTTPTNRNRARSRWAYQHFLGVDLENVVSRIDADALLDTRNPTMHNPACTVCHIPLDPVAGAFQNYTRTGFYRPNGPDALPSVYKEPLPNAGRHEIGDGTRDAPEKFVERAVPLMVDGQVVLRHEYDYDAEEDVPVIRIDSITLRDHDTGESFSLDLTRTRIISSGLNRLWEIIGTSGDATLRLGGVVSVAIPVAISNDARYDIEVAAWREESPASSIAFAASFYRPGDTWFRDVREPGFEGTVAPHADTSARWLAQRIAEDPRFAEGAVKFWWPAIMGDEVERPPVEGDLDFEARLVAATAQAAEVKRLADGFRNGFHAGDRLFNLKDLLAAMVLSPWFRAERNLDDDPRRHAALRDVGARRILTPEELAAKTAAVTGYKWGRWIEPIWTTAPGFGFARYLADETNALEREYELLYGGIDSMTKQVRSRDVTPTMAAVAKAHAAQSSCPIVLRELYLVPAERRRLLYGIDLNTEPDTMPGEDAIRDKLVQLHYKLFGIEVTADSADVDAAFGLFADTLERMRRDGAGTAFRDGNRCDTDSDLMILQDVVDPPFLQKKSLDGYYLYPPQYEQNDPDGLLERTYDDPAYLARAWVVVLAYLMMDYRYLYL